MDGQKGAPVRLIETSIGQRGRYICLSHCWGDPKYHPRPLETNYESLKRHREEIPWESLPKTFQDAVSFVRLLGESYIWIDSLCIVQDCSEDWRQEASKMADIYMNSYLTLAATKSNDSTEGLFSMSDDKYKPYPYEVEENGSTYTVHYRKSLSHFFDKLDDRLEPTPLLQRAWAYQERLLSPRTLHFGNQELLWECKESTTCQCGVQFRKWGQTCPKLDVLCRYGFYSRLWHRVVEDYSVLQLTKESDRLPAIAGIAKRVQSLRGSEDYLAGLWRGSLLEDLQWRRYSKLGDISLGRRDRSVAPSWSW
ncbi:heterokaryon incompatibility protein-domain-containing protein, partial [Phyllosticta capitalensis]